jgi:hypothetical protein
MAIWTIAPPDAAGWTDVVSGLGSGLGAMASLAAVFVSAVAIREAQRAARTTKHQTQNLEVQRVEREEARARRELTIDIWKMWTSSDYRQYRVDAWAVLHGAARNHRATTLPKLKDLIDDRDANKAVGSIEHFVSEVSTLYANALLDKVLFDDLFKLSLQFWAGLLYQFDRTDSDAFSKADMIKAFDPILGLDHHDEAIRVYLTAGHPPR